jgi:hypothetical protein
MDIEKKSIAKALSIAWFNAIVEAAKSVGGERMTALELAKSHSAMIAQLTDTSPLNRRLRLFEVPRWKPEP